MRVWALVAAAGVGVALMAGVARAAAEDEAAAAERRLLVPLRRPALPPGGQPVRPVLPPVRPWVPGSNPLVSAPSTPEDPRAWEEAQREMWEERADTLEWMFYAARSVVRGRVSGGKELEGSHDERFRIVTVEVSETLKGEGAKTVRFLRVDRPTVALPDGREAVWFIRPAEAHYVQMAGETGVQCRRGQAVFADEPFRIRQLDPGFCTSFDDLLARTRALKDARLVDGDVPKTGVQTELWDPQWRRTQIFGPAYRRYAMAPFGPHLEGRARAWMESGEPGSVWAAYAVFRDRQTPAGEAGLRQLLGDRTVGITEQGTSGIWERRDYAIRRLAAHTLGQRGLPVEGPEFVAFVHLRPAHGPDWRWPAMAAMGVVLLCRRWGDMAKVAWGAFVLACAGGIVVLCLGSARGMGSMAYLAVPEGAGTCEKSIAWQGSMVGFERSEQTHDIRRPHWGMARGNWVWEDYVVSAQSAQAESVTRRWGTEWVFRQAGGELAWRVRVHAVYAMIALGLPVAAWLLLWRRGREGRRRLERGYCACGYDLRRTGMRCPECGRTRVSLVRRGRRQALASCEA